MHTVGIGLLGCGAVGGGVAELLLRSPSPFRKRDLDLALRKIAVRDVSKPRDVALPKEMLTPDAEGIVVDPEVDIVVEVIGGIEPARTFVLSALRNGKSVVTANKALLAEHGEELFRTAHEHRVNLLFEASVCAGIPIIGALRNGLVANRIESLYGILNGTTNYILTKMTDEGGTFESALREAQERGYAEADPSMDVDGTDAAQKLAILSRIAFRAPFRTGDIFCEGIRDIRDQDIEYARELGYTIKLLAIAKRLEDRIEARVHPVMIPSGSLLANIKHEFNAIEVVGDAVGTQVFYGRGAGRMPTASAVMADVVELARRKMHRAQSRAGEMLVGDDAPAPIPMDEIVMPYYFRLLVLDQPGVLARIASILASENISMASVIQQGRATSEEETVHIIMMTHHAQERSVRAAIRQIADLPAVKDRPQVIRVEEL